MKMKNTEKRKYNRKYHIYVSNELYERIRYLSYLSEKTQSETIREILLSNVEEKIEEIETTTINKH